MPVTQRLIKLFRFVFALLQFVLRRRKRDEVRDQVDTTRLFPSGLHSCLSCPHYQHARSAPEHALTVCPVCGITLLPKELPDEPRRK